MGIKELLTNQRDRIAELRTENMALKRQNAKMVLALKHVQGAECEVCRVCRCPKFERLFNDAFSRQLLNLRVERGVD